MRCPSVPAVYSNALQESASSILYNGLIEELVDVLQITDKQLMVSVPGGGLGWLVTPWSWGTGILGAPVLVSSAHVGGKPSQPLMHYGLGG